MQFAARKKKAHWKIIRNRKLQTRLSGAAQPSYHPLNPGDVPDQIAKPMRLSLIAMSGSGKSYWSAKLAKRGFRHFDCDRMIAAKLGPMLKRSDGTVLSLGEWMGFPYQDGYQERESQYLVYEKKVLAEIFAVIEKDPLDPHSKIVIDTTGSVIYTGKKCLDQLRCLTTVVYLEIPFTIKDQMLQAYRTDPRPVLWQGKFIRKPQENKMEALARCYAELLSARERLYRRYAHVTIPYKRYRKRGWRTADFLATIKMRLQQ
jgi:shikimate kinase